MTSDERAFLDAICEQPHDDTARLVYADWLTEQDRSDRAEFIRFEIELARTPPDTDRAERRRRVLLERRAELLKRHKAVWLAPFSPFAKESDFERGFVRSMTVPPNTFLHDAEKWLALAPLTWVKFTSCSVLDADTASYTWWIKPLFESPHLSRLETIDLATHPLTAENVEWLASHPDLSRLRELLLTWSAIRNEGAAVLAKMPQLRHLESLDLRYNSISDTGARAIAESEYLGGLKELRISGNSIRKRAWEALEDRFGDALVG
jgi:uncharacterized protein (TIGR02996 family)